ncbi:MAG TPA: hypothetical protein VE993_19200, partial [Stellaceae bacterium]|nr:hypothetical protein [Stellaceae bacterium]
GSMLALSLRGAERRSNLDLGAHCPTRLLRCARNDSHSIGFDQPDLVSDYPLVGFRLGEADDHQIGPGYISKCHLFFGSNVAYF